MKLVRDHIPLRHPRHEYRHAEGGELDAFLRLKLVEEAAEAASARNAKELTEELGDVLEAIYAIAAYNGISLLDLALTQGEKRGRLGGFDNGIVMTNYIVDDGEK